MTAPEVPHADLIARLRTQADYQREVGPTKHIMLAAADALAALGDTVPREQYDRMMVNAKAREQRQRKARDRARSEGDALAHVIKQAPHARNCTAHWDTGTSPYLCNCYRSTAPAVSLALHDAEVKAQALDEALGYWSADPYAFKSNIEACAAAIREEAGRG